MIFLAFKKIFIGNFTLSYFLYYKLNKKSSIEIELLIKGYSAVATTETSIDKFLHPKKNGEKEIWMVQTQPDDMYWWFEIAFCWGYGFSIFSC